MTQSNVHATARCEECSKAYRVSNVERTYTCKACGGTVRADADTHEEPPVVIDGTVTCTECEAINPGGMHFCFECGAILEPSVSPEGNEAAARYRHEASEALKKASATIGFVTIAYRMGALAYGLATILAVLSLADTSIPLGPGVLVVVVTAALFAALLMGALHIQLRPFLWTVAIAVLATLVTVVHLVGPNPYGIAMYGSAAWALFAWFAIVPTRRFSRLIDKHRDLYVLHHASAQTRRSLNGRSAHERHERLMLAMQRAGHRAWKLSALAAGGFVLAVAVGSFAVTTFVRPAEFPPVLNRFEQAWSQADVEAMGELYDSRVRGLETARLGGLISAHGWSDAAPALPRASEVHDGSSVSVTYALEDFDMTIDWAMVDGEWKLIRVELPIPSVKPRIAAFREAWAASDIKAISGFFAESSRAQMFDRISKSAQNRGWEPLPEILGNELVESGAGEATAEFDLGQGELKTEWNFGTDGVWRLHAFRLPKR